MRKLKLYTELAWLYDLIYPFIFDYRKIANLIDKELKKYKLKNILDAACGTGYLAELLIKRGYNVTLLDKYREMLRIARKRIKHVNFIQSDMRKISSKTKYDAIIITGRSFTYMLTNRDVIEAFKSFYNTLKKGGILLFDNIKAEEMIKGKIFNYTKKIKINNKKVIRIYKSTLNSRNPVTIIWNAMYKIENKKKKKFRDQSILRGFYKNELKIMLNKVGFKEIKFLKGFDSSSFITIAKKQF